MRKENGFTLIEIIITVLIVGILATMAAAKLSWVVDRGRSVEANEILLKAYAGYQRTIIDEDWVSSGNPLTWDKMGMGDPHLNTNRFFDYSIDNPANPTFITAVRRNNASRNLTINLDNGTITKTQPY